MAKYTDAELARADVYLAIWQVMLEQPTGCLYGFDERSDRGGKASEALPVTCGNMI